jgi:hypothetical protein
MISQEDLMASAELSSPLTPSPWKAYARTLVLLRGRCDAAGDLEPLRFISRDNDRVMQAAIENGVRMMRGRASASPR